MKYLFPLLLFLLNSAGAQEPPLRLGVVGLTHTHVHWILGREKKDDVLLVGIVEPNKALAERYARQHGFPMSIVFNTMEDMIAAVKPEAVAAFGTIYEHLQVVRVAAPLGIHVMVEKPLAVSMEHAREMAALAKKYQIHLLTNYETSWYPTNYEAYTRATRGDIGSIRKIVVRDGHRGPKNIGINKEFLDWLTDPVQNGGGAVVDFGCYGANLSTWLLNGQRPRSVTAVLQQMQPEHNPRVDDEATIILRYDSAQTIIQASWNWPIGRKDLEVYGMTGAVYADNRHQFRLRMAEGYDGFREEIKQLPEMPSPYNDPFAYLHAVLRKRITVPAFGLYSLENNLLVVEILDAARQSAREGKTIPLPKHAPTAPTTTTGAYRK
jgi:predicted dehydrogenase